MGFEVIKELAKQKGKSLESIANYAGISYNSLSKIIRNTIQNPRYSTIKHIAEALNMTISELNQAIDPSGVPLHSSETLLSIDAKERDYIEKYRSLDAHGKRIVDSVLDIEIERIATTDIYPEISATRSALQIVPNGNKRLIQYHYRLASAGTGQILFDLLPSMEIEIPDIPAHRNASYAIGVNGNSMYPAYSDGDILIVEIIDNINTGDIGIFSVDNNCYVKKLGVGELISVNDEYDNIPLTEDSRCMGRVIGKL